MTGPSSSSAGAGTSWLSIRTPPPRPSWPCPGC